RMLKLLVRSALAQARRFTQADPEQCTNYLIGTMRATHLNYEIHASDCRLFCDFGFRQRQNEPAPEQTARSDPQLHVTPTPRPWTSPRAGSAHKPKPLEGCQRRRSNVHPLRAQKQSR